VACSVCGVAWMGEMSVHVLALSKIYHRIYALGLALASKAARRHLHFRRQHLDHSSTQDKHPKPKLNLKTNSRSSTLTLLYTTPAHP